MRELQLVVKTETPSLHPSHLHQLSVLDLADGWVVSYRSPADIAAVTKLLRHADLVITHSDFHLKHLGRLFGLKLDPNQIADTLAMCKMLYPRDRNGLCEWGSRLGMPRRGFRGAEDWSPAIGERCEADCRLIARLYQHLLSKVA